MGNLLSPQERAAEWIDAETVAAAGIGLGLAGMWRRDFEKLVAAKRELDTQLNQRPGVVATASAEYSRDPALHGQFGSRAVFCDSRLRTMGFPPLMADEAQAIDRDGRLL